MKLYDQKKNYRIENIYVSHVRALLGESYDQTYGILRGLNRNVLPFEKPTARG